MFVAFCPSFARKSICLLHNNIQQCMVSPCLVFNASTLLLNDQENPLQALAVGKIAFNGRG